MCSPRVSAVCPSRVSAVCPPRVSRVCPPRVSRVCPPRVSRVCPPCVPRVSAVSAVSVVCPPFQSSIFNYLHFRRPLLTKEIAKLVILFSLPPIVSVACCDGMRQVLTWDSTLLTFKMKSFEHLKSPINMFIWLMFCCPILLRPNSRHSSLQIWL